MISTGISNNFSATSIKPHSYTHDVKSDDTEKKTGETKQDQAKTTATRTELSEEDLEKIDQLQDRDREVKAHEQAHVAAGGQYVGSASFEYETGPDGVRYAIGGEVPIDVSEIPDDPEATVEKMEIVQKAALAPVEPSAADRAVAAAASIKETEARQEIVSEQAQFTSETSPQKTYSDAPEKGTNLDIKV